MARRTDRRGGSQVRPVAGRMSRSRFLKGVGVAGAGVVAAGVGLGRVARAQPVDTVEVYPSGDPVEYPTAPGDYSKRYTIDVLEVQSATVGGTLEENWDVKEITVNSDGQVTAQVPVPFPPEILSARNPNNMESYPLNVSGRTVLLKSTYSPGGTDHTPFDFGTPHPWYADLLPIGNPYPYEYPIKVSNVRFREGEDTVNVSVDIVGEGSGLKKTTILGGSQCFFACGQNNKFSPDYEYLGLDGMYAKVSIRNIRFQNPSVAIYAYYNLDLTVDSCDIMDFIPEDADSSAFAIFGHTAGRFVINNCVAVSHDDAGYAISEMPFHYSGMPDFFWSFPTFDVGGAYVEFTNNYVIGTYADSSLAGYYPDLFYPPHHGIMAADLLAQWTGREETTAIIKNNWIAAEMGIGCIGKYGTAEQPTEITGNHIVPSYVVARQKRLKGLGPLPTNRIEGARSWGMQCYAAFPPDWGLPATMLSNATIANNEIVMAGSLPQFDMQSYVIQLSGSGNSIHGNRVSGHGDYGAYLFGESEGNRFNGNNMAGYDAEYLYYFEAGVCGNTVKGLTGGRKWLVWDTDGCNDVSGMKGKSK